MNTDTGNANLMPSLTDVAEELQAFLKHHMPTLILSSVNAFCDAEHTLFPKLWKDHIFQCRVRRIPEPLLASHPWARFQAESAGVCSDEALIPRIGGSDAATLAEHRAHRTKTLEEQRNRGLGTMTVSVLCIYQGRTLVFFADCPFPIDAPLDVATERVRDWREVFSKNVTMVPGHGNRSRRS